MSFPRTRAAQQRPSDSNLPLELTSLVGRERERAEVEGLLADHRLLTLTGPGGCGKTRLALAVARDLVGSCPDGVWLVELASLSDEALVPQAVASTLEVREQPNRPLTETLVEHLGSKEMLIVLDNCEHLVEGCAALADALLRACPGSRILATSREALGVAGERAWPVPSLLLPDPEQRPPIEELGRYEAIRLFVERAKVVVSAFELTEQNASAVARLCRRLDGMPLAIELAAARVRVLSVGQIASRLDNSFGLLTGGSRTASPRQRTLRATIEWSHDLLSEDERVLFRRLSVFAGGCTLEAAEAVCAGKGIERDEVLDLLTHLVDKSLVLVAQQDGEVRYRLSETVGQYGREKLNESGEEPAIRRHHAGFFLKLAERAEPEINSKDRRLWLERLEVEHDNFRAALAWSQEEATAEVGLRLAGALLWFWFHRGYWSEGRRWLDGALATGEGAERSARAKALCGAGGLAWLQGDHDAAHSHLEESVTLWRELGEKQGLAQALRFLSAEFESRGEYALARSLVEESVELFREGPDTFGLGMTLARLGITATNQGDYAVARTALEEGVAICRETEDNRLLSLALRHLAFAALKQGDHERAAALLGESLGVLRGAGEEFSADSIWSLEFLAAAVSVQGESERAARLFGAAEALREALGAAVLYPADRDRGVAAARAGLDEATFAAAWTEGRAMTPEQAVEYALGEVREPAAPPTTAPLPGRTPAGTKKPTETVPAEAKAPQPQLRIFALGASRVEKDEHALASSEWGYAKPKELLFYLLSHPPRTKEQVGLALWPEASTAQLRSNFHVTVYRLRRALGRPEWIVFENGRYAFNRSLSYFFDAEAFELGLAEARRAQAEEAPGRAIARLEEALDLYRGDFLEDLAIEGEWAMVRQEELRRECLDGLLELGRLLFAEGRHEEATVTYRKAIGQEPYLEEAHRGLMLCQARLGERGQALKHYQRLVEMLGEEVGSEPAPETRKLFESLRSGEDA